MEVIAIIAIIIGCIILLLGLSCWIFGFRTVGVAAESCAAYYQSTIGNVVKGSCFDLMTSLGMKGCFVLLIIIGMIILIIVGAYYTVQWFKHVPSSNSSNNTMPINSTEQFQYAYEWFLNISFN